MLNTKKNYLHIGILSAMPEEVGVILDNLKTVKVSSYGDLKLFSGEFNYGNSQKVIVTTAWSGWGKVSAARATTRLLSVKYDELPVDIILFTGVAGAVDEKLKQWDIVVSESLMQHDMDASPLFDKYVIPALKEKKIFPDKFLLDKTFNGLKESLLSGKLVKFGSLFKGLIVTGDKFISDSQVIEKLKFDIPGTLAVEMEGAAFAQVANQEKIDWLVIRVISDDAGEEAGDEFNNFLEKYKNRSFELICCFIESLSC